MAIPTYTMDGRYIAEEYVYPEALPELDDLPLGETNPFLVELNVEVLDERAWLREHNMGTWLTRIAPRWPVADLTFSPA